MMEIKTIFILLVVALLLCPANAITITAEPFGPELQSDIVSGISSYSYDASKDNRGIQRIGIDIPINTRVDFTLTYGAGTEATGYFEYTSVYTDPITGTGFVKSDIQFAGLSSSYTYGSNELIGRVYLTGYARNDTSGERGIVVAGSTLAVTTWTTDFVFYPVPSTTDVVITKIEFMSTKPVTVWLYTNPYDAVASAADKSILDEINDWVEFAKQMAAGVLAFVTELIYWIKFLFVDNLGLTVSLYMALTLCFAARKSPGNMARILRTWFNDQKNLFHFIIGLWNLFVDTVAQFRGIFRI